MSGNNNTSEAEKEKTYFVLVGTIFLIVGIVVGSIGVVYFMPSAWSTLVEPIKIMPDRLIITVLLLGIFLAVLYRFFDTKTEGFGPFTSTTLLMILSLMVVSVLFLIGAMDSDDITKVILTIIGFVGGLLVGRDK